MVLIARRPKGRKMMDALACLSFAALVLAQVSAVLAYGVLNDASAPGTARRQERVFVRSEGATA
jgi:hypothetical protein